MTVSTLRPNGTTSNTGAVVGAASAHTALNDDSDATYIAFDPGEGATFTLDDLALPGDAVLKQVALRLRIARAGLDPGAIPELSAQVVAVGGTPSAGGTATPTWTTPTTVALGFASADWTDALLDDASLVLSTLDDVCRVYEAEIDATYVEQPTLIVTGPTGTLNTNIPTVTWSTSIDSDGGPQTHYQAKIFTAAQYGAGGFDPRTATPTQTSGILAGANASWTTNAALPDGTYRAYVNVAQTVNGVQHWGSGTAYSEFTISLALPAVPTITATAESSSGRNKIVVSSNSGAATTDAIDLVRSLDNGLTWVPVRHAGGLVERVSGTLGIFYDYEAPNGLAMRYEARALHNYSGQYAASAWAPSAFATWSSTSWWLKHPNLPALNRTIELVTYGDVTRAARNGSFQPFGASLPIVVSDTRAGATGASTIRTRTTAARDELEDLATLPDTLLLQGPLTAGEPDRYIRVGDLSAARVIENINRPFRTFTLPWVEVARPAGALSAAQYTPPVEPPSPTGGVFDTATFDTSTFG